MNIQVNDFYRIVSIPLNIVIEKRNSRKLDEKNSEPFTKWSAISYHPHLESACIALYGILENKVEAETIQELRWEIKNIKEGIIEAVIGNREKTA